MAVTADDLTIRTTEKRASLDAARDASTERVARAVARAIREGVGEGRYVVVGGVVKIAETGTMDRQEPT
jgi:hypothetical protein